MLKYFKN